MPDSQPQDRDQQIEAEIAQARSFVRRLTLIGLATGLFVVVLILALSR